jgi:chemotaxis protein MotB
LDLEKYQNIMRAFAGEFRATQNTDNKVGVGDFFPDDWEGLVIPPATDTESETGRDKFGESSQIGRLYGNLSGYIQNNDLEEEMQVKIVGDSLLITLTSDIWFPSGSAVISMIQRETARKMSDMIAANQTEEDPFRIVITGHTDNVPMSTAQFPSNWYLSAIRAINFMEAMLYDDRLDPRIFSARGYGEFEPINTNDTAEGRQHNRRVEVLISLDHPLVESE